MNERVVIPPENEIEIINRRKPSRPPEQYLPYTADPDGLAPMADCGDGYRVHMTGLPHDDRGYPAMTPEAQQKMVERLTRKIQTNRNKIIKTENVFLDDADIVVVAYGISSRTARHAVHQARESGIRAGLIKLETVWPFPEDLIRTIAPRVRALIMPEINAGQIVLELERCAGGACPVELVCHLGGTIIRPGAVLAAIQKYTKGKGVKWAKPRRK